MFEVREIVQSQVGCSRQFMHHSFLKTMELITQVVHNRMVELHLFVYTKNEKVVVVKEMDVVEGIAGLSIDKPGRIVPGKVRQHHLLYIFLNSLYSHFLRWHLVMATA